MKRGTFPPIQVEQTSDGRPCRIRYRGRVWRVSVVDEWLETGRWWQGENQRVFYRLLTEHQRVLEVSLEPATQRWALEKWLD
jgi:hypothetical protein